MVSLYYSFSTDEPICPTGMRIRQCDRSLCTLHRCLTHTHSAVCLIDPCDQCKVKFYINGTDVTESCVENGKKTVQYAILHAIL